MKAKPKKMFTVYARLKLEIGLEVEADTFDQALEKAKLLKEDDFVEIKGEFNDGEVELYGIYSYRS